MDLPIDDKDLVTIVEALNPHRSKVSYLIEDKILYASDYFDQMYVYAIQLIEKGKAYVDDQDSDTIKNNRGTLSEPGIDSPFRNRSIDENLQLFHAMKDGKYDNGAKGELFSKDCIKYDMSIVYKILSDFINNCKSIV